MKLRGTTLAYAGLIALFSLSCFDPPEYSNVPEIEFESVSFVDLASGADSLILAVRFTDGDGDMGFNAEGDTLMPYNSQNFFDTIRSNPIPYYYPYFSNVTFITYKTYRTDRYGWKGKLSVDTLPPFIKPYYCTNWFVRSVGGVIDTFYYEANPYHYNLKVEFLVKNSDGSFSEFDWRDEFAAYPSCGITLDGRFPILSRDLTRPAALDGRIRYAMQSTGFTFLFNIKTLKLRITVADRALNLSNTVETPEFTLQQIKK